MNLPFSILIQIFCDKAGVPEISRVDKRVLMITTAQTKTYLALPMRPGGPATVPWKKLRASSVFTKPTDVHRGDVVISIDLEIGKQREASNLST